MRITRAIATVVLAVAVLVTASVGMSTAATPVTKALVKKIAKSVAKDVVKTEAGKLSVADSQKLAGKPASSYLTRAYSYAIPDSAATTSKTFYFDSVPAGTYLVTYNLLADGGAVIECYLGDYVAASPKLEGFARGVTLGATSHAVNASGVQKVTGIPYLTCASDGPAWSVAGLGVNAQSRITYTRLDEVTGIAPSAPPPF